MTTTRRGMIGALAASSASLAGTALAAPAVFALARLKKEPDVACLYHCGFGDPQRFSAMLQNMNNHYSAYEFDAFKLKLERIELVGRVVVVHVLQHRRKTLRVAEAAVIETGDVRLLLQARKGEHRWRGERRAGEACA